MTRSIYSELELKYARPLAAGLIADHDFREWLLSGTRYERLARTARHDSALQQRQRGNTMTNPYWFNYWCGKDRNCACRVGTAVETDILLVFDCEDKTALALHVEIKRPGDTLRSGQAVTYPRRAACWANEATRPRRIPPHSEFLTILACGSNLRGNPDLIHFDKVIFHDEIATHLNPYPDA